MRGMDVHHYNGDRRGTNKYPSTSTEHDSTWWWWRWYPPIAISLRHDSAPGDTWIDWVHPRDTIRYKWRFTWPILPAIHLHPRVLTFAILMNFPIPGSLGWIMTPRLQMATNKFQTKTQMALKNRERLTINQNRIFPWDILQLLVYLSLSLARYPLHHGLMKKPAHFAKRHNHRP